MQAPYLTMVFHRYVGYNITIAGCELQELQCLL